MGAYGRFVAAAGLTNLADGVAVVAWAWAASLLTRDALLIALVPVALRLPWFVLALPAGVITDRVDRRRLILAMDILRAIALALLALAVWAAMPLSPAQGVPWLYPVLLLVALVVGGAEVFRDNAAQTVLPALVAGDRLEQANGRMWSVEMIANALIGPVLGAWLIGLWLPLPFALNAAAFALAALLVGSMAGRFRPERQSGPWRAELAEGLAFLRASPLLRIMALTTGGWNLCHQMIVVALVLHAQENLDLDASTYGLMLAGGAVGGVAGSLLGARVAQALGPVRTMQVMLAASAPAFVMIALAPGAWGVALALAFMELTGLIWNVVSVSHRQRLIPDALLGRVNSLYRLLAWGMIPLGLVLSGLIVALGETLVAREAALVWPFWTAAAGAALLALAAWAPLRRAFG